MLSRAREGSLLLLALDAMQYAELMATIEAKITSPIENWSTCFSE